MEWAESGESGEIGESTGRIRTLHLLARGDGDVGLSGQRCSLYPWHELRLGTRLDDAVDVQLGGKFVDLLALSKQARLQFDQGRTRNRCQVADLQIRRHRFDALLEQAVRHRRVEQGGGHPAVQRARIPLPFRFELERGLHRRSRSLKAQTQIGVSPANHALCVACGTRHGTVAGGAGADNAFVRGGRKTQDFCRNSLIWRLRSSMAASMREIAPAKG